jgi:glycine cleavage system aminomethyltransferase T
MAQPVAVYTDAVEEHLATRRSCGLFDFSFMGHFEVAGAGARAFLDRLQTRNLAALAPGRIYYTLLLRPDGTVLIDATLWCRARDRYWLFTGRPSDFAFVAEAVRHQEVALRDLSGANAVLAVQGPRSARVLERHLGAAPGVAYFGFREARVGRVPVTIGCVGYSGELGYEVIVPADSAPGLWRALATDARECGFDAANSLRVESGYILFTNELEKPVNPFELGLERLLSFDGCRFTGSEALRAQRWRAPERQLVGLDGFARRDPSSLVGLPRAQVTSRVRSPTLGRELALGFVPGAATAPGTLVAVSASDRARVARLPFYDPPRSLPRRAVGAGCQPS